MVCLIFLLFLFFIASISYCSNDLWKVVSLTACIIILLCMLRQLYLDEQKKLSELTYEQCIAEETKMSNEKKENN